MGSFGEEILIFCGPMRSGKSNELLIQIDKLKYAKIPFLILKPDIDSRTPGFIFTRYRSESEKAIEINSKNPREILDMDEIRNLKLPLTIAIDEAQFFDHSIVDVVRELNSRGVNFLISGLDVDANGNDFGPMGALMAISTKVRKLRGICELCHGESTKTGLRKVIPEFNEGNIVVVTDESVEGKGDLDLFIALCTSCYYKNKEKLAKSQ